MKKIGYLLVCVAMCGCGTVQSIVKSTFPYTTDVVIPSTSPIGKEYSAISSATSFDQRFFKNGNSATKLKQIHIISAKLKAITPVDYNIGNIQSVKIFMAKINGDGEVMVAQRTDIGPSVGSTLVLDINNTPTLDELAREPSIRVRVEYKLRGTIIIDANLHVVLNIKGEAAN